ncbi:hypothetical protein DK459_29305 [Achromobacter sp. RW408]|nr:hypothetical protein DK459_29305 [Achromobacter sp. RW408]
MPTGEGWLYVAAVMHLAGRRIVDWSMSEAIDATQVCTALKSAWWQRKPTKALLVNSDRGPQYASGQYRALTADLGITMSMSRKAAVIPTIFNCSMADRTRIQRRSQCKRHQGRMPTWHSFELVGNEHRCTVSGQGHCRRVGIAADDSGHDGRVDHPKIIHAPDAQTRINYSTVVASHAARTDGMPHGAGDAFCPFGQLCVGLVLNTGVSLFLDDAGQRLLFHDFTRRADRLNDLLDILAIRQIIRIDKRHGHWIAVSQPYPATTARLKQN